jgi:WhiB family redox-sensing transcriptional regulator
MDENAYSNFLRTFRFLSDYSERDWLNDAACKGMDTAIFFPEKPSARDLKKIEGICNSCPVKSQCRDYGDEERYGFWGGVGTRRRIRERTSDKVPSTVDG